MNTVPFTKSQNQSKRPHSRQNQEYQDKKKDIATYLSSHVQPNPTTSLTLTDPSGKTISLKCNTGDPAELLGLAIGFLSH